MNFNIIHKIIALPLSTTENSIAFVLAYHTQKDGNSCFPSYKTIHKESGASNKTISKVIRTLKYAGVIDYKHRANIGTNKNNGIKYSNEYFFIFDDIEFYRNKLTIEKTKLFISRLKESRVLAINDMEQKNRKLKANLSHKHTPKPSQMLRIEKPRNVNNDVCTVAGLTGCLKPSHFTPKPSQMLRRSNRENVQLEKNSTSKDNTKEPCNKKKIALHVNKHAKLTHFKG